MTKSIKRARLDVEAAARDWLILLHSGRARASDLEELARWRAANSTHDAAFREVEYVWALLGGLGASAAEVEAAVSTVRAPRPSIFSCAVAASVAFLFAAGVVCAPSIPVWFANARTAPAEVRTVKLTDGTSLTLNGNSAVSWHFSAEVREIDLLRGEAYIKVIHDAKRPFVVDADDAHIRDIGTKFDVSLNGGVGRVAVEEGVVSIETADNVKSTRVLGGQQVLWDGKERLSVGSANINDAIAWRRGKIIFEARPLGEVIAELQRYRAGYVFILNNTLRSCKVTGVFDSSDPDAVLDAIAHSLPARVMRVTPYLAIIS